MKYDLDSYKSFPIFGFITDDLTLIIEMLRVSFEQTIYNIGRINKELEIKRNSLINGLLDGEDYSNYFEQLRNDQLKDYLIRGGILYYYSQFEIKLFNICERLPLLLENCQEFNEFVSDPLNKNKSKLEKISKYLLFIADIDIKSFEKWQSIVDFKEIRDYAAHNEEVKKNKINTFKSIRNRNREKIIFNDGSMVVLIQNSYLFDIMSISHDFLDEILNEIWNKHNK
jgi:hypothetical protein